MLHCIPCEGTLQLAFLLEFPLGASEELPFSQWEFENFEISHWEKVENIFSGSSLFAWEHQKIGPQGKLRPNPKEFFCVEFFLRRKRAKMGSPLRNKECSIHRGTTCKGCTGSEWQQCRNGISRSLWPSSPAIAQLLSLCNPNSNLKHST